MGVSHDLWLFNELIGCELNRTIGHLKLNFIRSLRKAAHRAAKHEGVVSFLQEWRGHELIRFQPGSDHPSDSVGTGSIIDGLRPYKQGLSICKLQVYTPFSTFNRGGVSEIFLVYKGSNCEKIS